ncbi:MAG: cytochrome c3 family protein [Planctomycetes bacterium]|nr:cytochrome c3 family protein [Planctomycetota bacterium]
MTRNPSRAGAVLAFAFALLAPAAARGQEDGSRISEATQACLFCHENLHPGLVADWRLSRHARTTMAEALAVDEPARRVSTPGVPEELRDVVVGCAECHTHAPDTHPDTVEHGEARVHPVVTPRDCALCHPREVDEYGQNLMAHAYENLLGNDLFSDLADRINGVESWTDGALAPRTPHAATTDDSCLACHGTDVQVVRRETRDTGLGEMEFPVLTGWPNVGVGRVNPDGSRGSCSACHTRHEFSIAMARKPYTCAQCHKGPDVPAFKVWEVSKHGNIYAARGEGWDFEAVPWRPGRHFSAPTCATCHISRLVNDWDMTLAERTHRMNDRLDTRLFGLPYAHPHPKDPRTSTIRNRAGMPLPTELTGEPVATALIGADERAARRNAMQAVCLSCHSRSWIGGHFDRLDHSIATTNESTRTATAILLDAWRQGVATGPANGGSPFDETLERMWVDHWLMYANSTRFASAMMGADYGVFADGRYALAANLRRMQTLVRLDGGRR